MIMYLYFLLCALCFIIPIVEFILNKVIRQTTMQVCGLTFTALVAGLIAYRVIFVVPVVPKVRYDIGPTRVHVCGHDAQTLEKYRSEAVPQCELEFYVDETPCVCASSGEQTAIEGVVEFVLAPPDEDGEFAWRVEEESLWIDEDGKAISVGRLTGGCARSNLHPGKTKHELVHLCGYHHAIGDPTNRNVNNHVMSRSKGTIGTDTRGLDVAHKSLYIPVIE